MGCNGSPRFPLCSLCVTGQFPLDKKLTTTALARRRLARAPTRDATLADTIIIANAKAGIGA